MRPPMFIPFKNLFVQSNNTVEKKKTKRHGFEGSIAIVDSGKYFNNLSLFHRIFESIKTNFARIQSSEIVKLCRKIGQN